MGGYFPGPLGFAEFVGVKFGGYAVAGIALKKLQPTISAGAIRIAATRTGLGILLGPPMTLLGAFLIGFFLTRTDSAAASYGAYAVLFLVRILGWSIVIYILTKQTNLATSRLWTFALLGAAWSCLLDWPGFKLAMIAPGQIPVC